MIYFVILISCILVLCYVFYKKKQNKRIFLISTFILVSLFQGLRSFNIGTDLPGYIIGFNSIGKSNFSNLSYQNYEFGYVLFNKTLYFIGFSDRFFLLTTSFIINSSIFYLIYRYSKEPLLSILWYFTFGTFIVSFSALRQCIGISILLFSLVFVEKKKLIAFILMILLASTFHSSCIIGILFYPVFNSRSINYLFKFKSKLALSLVFVFLIFIFRVQIFTTLSRIYYGESLNVALSNSYTKFLIYLLLFIVSFFRNNKTQIYRGIQNILLICVCGYAFAGVHPYFTRTFYVFETAMAIFIPLIFSNVVLKNKRIFYLILNLMLILLYLLFFVGGYNTLPFSFL